MMEFPFWRTAVRLAWRDLRSSRSNAIFISIAMAVSIAGVAGVRGAADAARRTLECEPRVYLAGDIGVDLADVLGEDQAAELDRWNPSGIQWTRVTTAFTMAASEFSPDPGYIAIRVVDPAVYPFYGAIGLAPPLALRDALRGDGVVVSGDVLARFRIHIGDALVISGKTFHVSAAITSEPDRFSGAIGIGMRCIISRERYASGGIRSTGASVRNRILLRVPSGSSLPSVRERLRAVFPDGRIREYSGTYRSQTEAAITFLSVVAFLALMLGAIGVAIAVRHYADQRMATLAVMRMVGARTFQMAAIFFLQIGWMMAAALALGIPLGVLLRDSVLSVVGRYLSLFELPRWDFGGVLEGAAGALACLSPALMRPAFMIRNARPAVVLRRETGESGLPRTGMIFVAAGIGFVGLALLAYQLLRSWASAIWLVAGLAGCVGAAWILAAAALRFLSRWTAATKLTPFPILRHAIASLHRPGNRSRTLIVALAAALTLIAATFQASGVVMRAVFDLGPYDPNALYIAGFKETHRGLVRAFLEKLPGVESVEILTQARLELRQVKGPRLPTRGDPFERGSLSYRVVCDSQLSSKKALILADDEARHLGATTGSLLEFAAGVQTIEAKVVAIRKLTPAERVWSAVRLDCSALDPSSFLHEAAVRIAPDQLSNVRIAIWEKYPALAVITAQDLSDTISAVSADGMRLARLVALYAVGAGISILIATVAASRGSRLHEIGILSAIGARRRTILQLYTIEFAAIGLVSSGIASVLTCGFTSVVLWVIFGRLETVVDWNTMAITVVASAALTITAGWLPAYGLLRRKPLEVLRGITG